MNKENKKITLIVVIGVIILCTVIFYFAKLYPTSKNLKSGSNVSRDAPSALTAANFKGIIVGSSDTLSVMLSSYDPIQGLTFSRKFSLQGFNYPIIGIDGLNRQMFNKEYTWLAVSKLNADGSSDIGYIDTSGSFTNLTPQNTSYGDVEKQTKPFFDSSTGRIWFNTSTQWGSVDPVIGSTSSHNESGSYSDTSGIRMGNTIYSLNGQTMVYEDHPGFSDSNSGNENGFIINNTPVPTATGGQECLPLQFINNDSFLCKQDTNLTGMGDNSNTQLYKITISSNRKSVTSLSLLPNSDKTLIDALADPSGKQVAFIAQSGSIYSLYTTSAAGGNNPQKVADIENLGSNNPFKPALLSWQQ